MDKLFLFYIQKHEVFFWWSILSMESPQLCGTALWTTPEQDFMHLLWFCLVINYQHEGISSFKPRIDFSFYAISIDDTQYSTSVQPTRR